MKLKISIVLLLISSFVVFQNCGGSDRSSSIATIGASDTEVPSAESGSEEIDSLEIEESGADTEKIGSAEEPASNLDMVSASKASPAVFKTVLSWNPSARKGPQYDKVLGGLVSQCPAAISEIKTAEVPVAFVDEGIVSSKEKETSLRLAALLRTRFPHLGYCAHHADAKTAVQAQDVMASYLLRLASKYKGGTNKDKKDDGDDPGNPVNERHLIPVLYGLDMMWQHLSSSEQAKMKKFLVDLNNRLYMFMAKLPKTDLRLKNNWATDSYVLRAYVALVLRDKEKIAAIKSRLNSSVIAQFTAPKGWKLSSCKNLKAIGRYGSFDLQQRDAFLYHMKNIGMIAELAALRPDFFNSTAKARVLTGLEMTKPYVLGTKKHNEFDCSTVDLDRKRRASGLKDYSGPWDPAKAKNSFRFSRVAFPSTKAFTAAFTKDDYMPWMKVFVSGRGDVVLPQ